MSKNDSILITIWNQRKIHKRKGAGFLGCIRIMSNAISRIKDTGLTRLDLCKKDDNDLDPVRGQIVVSIESRDHDDRIPGGRTVQDARMIRPPIPPPPQVQETNELPEGWEERRTPTGRIQYINHYTR